AQRHAQVDVCVVGAGPSGMTAALVAALAGKRVLLVEQQAQLGGSLLHREAVIDDLAGQAWATRTVQALKECGAHVLPRSVAVALYDHNVVAVVQRGVEE